MCSLMDIAQRFSMPWKRQQPVSFMDYDSGYFDNETCRLEPH
jgi:hypothetical protein